MKTKLINEIDVADRIEALRNDSTDLDRERVDLESDMDAGIETIKNFEVKYNGDTYEVVKIEADGERHYDYDFDNDDDGHLVDNIIAAVDESGE